MDLKQTPFLNIPIIKTDIRKKYNKDGSIVLKSTVRLKKRPHRMTERLVYWATKTPDKIFIGQKDENGNWQTLTYAETLKKVKSIAQYLLTTDVSVEKPLAILSENSIEHGLMSLAALHIGVPYSPIATAYSLKSTDYAKLRHTIDLLTPCLIFVQDGAAYAKAIEAVAPNIEVIAVKGLLSKMTVFDDILKGKTIKTKENTKNTEGVTQSQNTENRSQSTANTEGVTLSHPVSMPNMDAVAAAFNNITPDTIAKILFTSGSTGLPKGVINTHGNITTNWQQITQTFPIMENGGLTFINWLPWNHVFGGNHNFGLTLYNGGSLYIDEGNPTPRGIGKTVQNLREIAPTMYCNVPKGFEDLIPYLQEDKVLCSHFFSNLKLLFYAGAGMPQYVWDTLEQLAYETTGKRLMISSGLGMTEASPSCMFNVHFGNFAGMIGTPVPALKVKLIPNGGKLETRFRAPNITPGYWRKPEATQKAFDTEGYYCTGDALKFVEETDPNKGMIFDGRIAEDFKLDTGTWVSVGVLKAKLIGAGNGLIQDAVITGHDRAFLGAIVFPELNFCRKLANLDSNATLSDIGKDPSVSAALQTVLNDFAKQNTDSSTLIKRAVFADFDLSIDKGEITDKGSINQRQILANHADVVAMIYEKTLDSRVIEVKKVA